MDLSYARIRTEISKSTQKILSDLDSLNEIQSEPHDANTDIDFIRDTFDSLQIDNKEEALVDLANWARIRKERYSKADERMFESIESTQKIMNEELTDDLFNMIHKIDKWDDNLKLALQDINYFHQQFTEIVEKLPKQTTNDNSNDASVPAMLVTKQPTENYVADPTKDELQQLKLREKHYQSIIMSQQQYLTDAKNQMQIALNDRNMANEMIKQLTKDLFDSKAETLQREEQISKMIEHNRIMDEIRKRRNYVSPLPVFEQKPEETKYLKLEKPSGIFEVLPPKEIIKYVPLMVVDSFNEDIEPMERNMMIDLGDVTIIAPISEIEISKHSIESQTEHMINWNHYSNIISVPPEEKPVVESPKPVPKEIIKYSFDPTSCTFFAVHPPKHVNVKKHFFIYAQKPAQIKLSNVENVERNLIFDNIIDTSAQTSRSLLSEPSNEPNIEPVVEVYTPPPIVHQPCEKTASPRRRRYARSPRFNRRSCRSSHSSRKLANFYHPRIPIADRIKRFCNFNKGREMPLTNEFVHTPNNKMKIQLPRQKTGTLPDKSPYSPRTKINGNFCLIISPIKVDKK